MAVATPGNSPVGRHVAHWLPGAAPPKCATPTESFSAHCCRLRFGAGAVSMFYFHAENPRQPQRLCVRGGERTRQEKGFNVPAAGPEGAGSEPPPTHSAARWPSGGPPRCAGRAASSLPAPSPDTHTPRCLGGTCWVASCDRESRSASRRVPWLPSVLTCCPVSWEVAMEQLRVAERAKSRTNLLVRRGPGTPGKSLLSGHEPRTEARGRPRLSPPPPCPHGCSWSGEAPRPHLSLGNLPPASPSVSPGL